MSAAADLVVVEQALDVAVALCQPSAPEVEILADVAHLDTVGRAVVLADGALGGDDELLGEFGTDGVAAVVAQLGKRRGVASAMASAVGYSARMAVASMLSSERT